MVLQRFFEGKVGLPPIGEINKLLSGENGKRINTILTRIESLASNQQAIAEMTRLLDLVHAMAQAGELDKLDGLLKALPRGKSGENLIIQVRAMIQELEPKLDKLAKLAQSILSEG